MRAHEIFTLAVELLDAPDDGILVGEVGDGADGGFEGGGVDVGGDGDDDVHVVGDGPGLELTLGLVSREDGEERWCEFACT